MTKFSDDDLLKLKGTFQKYYLMYKSFKEKEVKTIESGGRLKLHQLTRGLQDVQRDVEKDPKFKVFGSRMVKKEVEGEDMGK